jgi:hypothetical protein
MARLKMIYETRDPVIRIIKEDSPIYAPAENEEILDSAVTSEDEPQVEDAVEDTQNASENEFLLRMGLDPERHTIITAICQYEEND